MIDGAVQSHAKCYTLSRKDVLKTTWIMVMSIVKSSRFRLFLLVVSLIVLAAVIIAAFSARHQSATEGYFVGGSVPANLLAERYIADPVNNVLGYKTSASWDKNPVTYRFENCPNNLDCAQAHQAMREAMETWDALSGITLDETTSPNADINVSFAYELTVLNDFLYPDGPGGLLGVTSLPVDTSAPDAGDVEFDGTEFWTLDGSINDDVLVHLPTVALHEFGHSLGLGHSSDENALMWFDYTGPRTITPDDIAGIQAIYGPPEGEAEGSQPPLTGLLAEIVSDTDLLKAPSVDAEVLGTIPQSDQVDVLARTEDSQWLYAEYFGFLGWVTSEAVDLNVDISRIPIVSFNQETQQEDMPANPIDQLPPPASSVYAVEAVRVRMGPGTGFKQVYLLNVGTSVPVIGRNQQGTWLKVEYGVGQQGWVIGAAVELRGVTIDQLPVVE